MLEIKDVLKNFGKFSGENLSESLFSIELQAYTLQLYLKRYSGTGVSLWIFRNFSEKPLFQNTFGRLLLNCTQERYSSFSLIAKKNQIFKTYLVKNIVNYRMIYEAEISAFSNLLSRNEFSKLRSFAFFYQLWVSQHLLFKSQKCKYQNNVWNLFKVNNSDTRTTLLRLFLCLCVLTLSRGHTFLWYFHLDFRQVTAWPDMRC